ncbi:MAG: ATP-binding cassette domain-containing protein, partial [Myxococcota bacterium]
ATALKPTLGDVVLFGQNAARELDHVRARTALLTHHSHLYSDLSGEENLLLLHRLSCAPALGVSEALERVGLGEAKTRTVRTYSAGMKRRLGLARVLVAKPELVLLDEPFGQLDPEGVALMEEVIAELKRSGATLFVSTHDIERGKRIGDMHLEMEMGQPKRAVSAL